MIDRDQRIDAGGFGRRKLRLLQLAAIFRQHAQIVALQPDRRLLQVDDLDAGHGAQNILGGFDDAMNAGMAMQRDPHRHAFAQQRPQPVEFLAQEQRERRHLERLCTARLLQCRQRRLGELHLA